MRSLYLSLAIAGAILPYVFFSTFTANHGLDLAAFVAGVFANGAAGGFTADLLISSLVFWIWMFSRTEGPRPWLFIVLNLTIGLSCALPAYLYATTRKLAPSVA